MDSTAPYTAFEFTVRSGSALATNWALQAISHNHVTNIALTSALILGCTLREWRTSGNHTPWRNASATERNGRMLKGLIEGAGLGALAAAAGIGVEDYALPAANHLKSGTMAALSL